MKVVELMKGEASERRVEIAVELPGELPPISANREDLTRVFTNLMDNAIKYNSAGGRVFLRAKTVDAFLQVEVQDTGIGIPPEEKEKIFDEFYRVKNKDTKGIGGTGLGLSIAKKILSDHHGEISVKSEPDQGALFTIRIPIETQTL